MKCPHCGKENPARGAFCLFCGLPISVTEQLRENRIMLVKLYARVAALERLQRGDIPSTPAVVPERPGAEIEVESALPARRPAAMAMATTDAMAAHEGPPAASEVPPAPPARPAATDWERVLGRNWFAIIGAVALAVGAVFFMALAIQNKWIDERGQIIIGIAAALALLGVGEYTHRRYPNWAQAVTGCGIGILYVSIYASFGFYHLIEPLAAFLFLGLLALLGGLLALRHESLVIGLLSISIAFLTPALLGRSLDQETRFLVLVYILVVDAGILAVSTFRNWRWFTLVGMAASYFLFAMLVSDIPRESRLLAELGLTGILIIFAGATTMFHIVWRRQPAQFDLWLMTLNAAVFFALTYSLMWAQYRSWFGFVALVLSLFYGSLAYAALRRKGVPAMVALFSSAIALVFLTVAVPLQLQGTWITIAWAAEGAVLAWLGCLLKSRPTRVFSLLVFAVAAFRLLVFDTPLPTRDFQVILNDRFISFAVSIAAFYFGSYAFRRELARIEQQESSIPVILAGAANVFTVWLLSAELISYIGRQGSGLSPADARNALLLGLTMVWAVYGAGLVSVALRLGSHLRWGGLGLLAVAAAKLLFVDSFAVRIVPSGFQPVLNYQFLTFLVVLLTVIASAIAYRNRREALPAGERRIASALAFLANLVAFWWLSGEVIRFFDARSVVTRTSLESAKHLYLTVLWALYAVALIGAGIARRSRTVRLAGIALLGLPVAKLFVFDVFLLQQGFRVAAFVILGILLLAIGLVYQRYKVAVKGFFLDKR